MRNAGRSTSKAFIAILAAAGAAGFLALGSTLAFAGDSTAAETLAADALYERVGDSTTTDAPAAATSPAPAAAAADSAPAAPASVESAPSGPVSADPVPAPPTTADPIAAAPAPPDSVAAAPASPTAAAVVPAAAASPSPSPAASTSETVVVPDSGMEPSFAAQNALEQSTTEIPSTAPDKQQASPSDAQGDDSDIVNYQKYQSDPALAPRLHSLQEFISEGSNSSPLGIEVEQSAAKLSAGGKADGLLIVDVTANSPAAKAGLHAYRRTVSDILKGVSVAGALFFPPAVMLVPIMDQVHIAETSDLIIAVDGSRVTDYMQFADRMRDVRPGEIVYLSIVRNGARVQVPVKLPATPAPQVF